MDTRINLTKGSVIKALIVFSVPFLISNLFQQLYNVVDTYIVGNYLDELSLAAMGVCGGIFELIVGFMVGVGSGLGIVIARYYGANNIDMVRKTFALSVKISVIVSLVVMILSAIGLYPLLKLLNTPDEIIDDAYSYIVVIGLGAVVTMAYNLFSSVLKAIGNSLVPLVFLSVSTVINVILDYIFVAIMNLGLRGAALGTVIATFGSALMCIIFIFRKYQFLIPKKSDFKGSRYDMNELWSQGLAMGFMSSIVSIGTIVLQFGINSLDNMIIAAHTAARKLFAFSTLPITTLGMSITTFASQNLGAAKRERIIKGEKYANIITSVWSVIATILTWLFADTLVRWISGSDNQVLIDNGTNYLKFNVLFFIPLGILINTRFLLQGIGSKVLPIISSVIELVGKIIFTFILIPKLEYQGVIICEPVVWCVMMVQLVISFYMNPYIRGKKMIKTE